MWHSFLTDVVAIVHIGFVLFVLFGGLLILKWPRVMWLHLPAVTWGALVEFTGWICPLTPLENWLRGESGQVGYEGDFLLRFLLPLLYPEALTRPIQILLGAIALTVNLAIYTWLWRRHRRNSAGPHLHESSGRMDS
jgi:uncharacterized protein DUF2784